MPPVVIHTDSPLRPQLPTGITSQTASSDDQPALPQHMHPTRTITATTTSVVAQGIPAPPQPGARPLAPTMYAPLREGNASSALEFGAVPNPPISMIESSQASLPSQFTIPPPPETMLPTKSTSTVPPPPRLGETRTTAFPSFQPSSALPQQASVPQPSPIQTRHGRAHSLEHPPNYAQNPYVDGTSLDRERKNSLIAQEEAEEGILGKVTRALGDAGSKLAEVEKQAWNYVKQNK